MKIAFFIDLELFALLCTVFGGSYQMQKVHISETLVISTCLHGVTYRKKVKYIILCYLPIFSLRFSGVSTRICSENTDL